MGLLLWSEFGEIIVDDSREKLITLEFSDAEYPTNPDYLANYEAEAYYNIVSTFKCLTIYFVFLSITSDV
jgi:hypothetical protein